MLHDGYKVSHFWDKVEGLKEHRLCTVCGVHDTMQHIMSQCRASGQEQIWNLASQLWWKKDNQDLQPTIGQIYLYVLPNPNSTLTSANEMTENQRTNFGKQRLRTIISLESAYLIWKMQNDRVINGKDPPST